MKISFLLPCLGRDPIGGLKIVYQYADGLAGRGHEVAIVHPAFMSSEPVGVLRRLRGHVLKFLAKRAMGGWTPDSWFKFRNAVELKWVPALLPIFVPISDVYVATWWQTAEHLAKWAVPAQRLYLIQHYEIWGGPDDRVLATWRAPLTKIVIAKWLENIATSLGEKAAYIPNALDFDQFGCDEAITDRCRFGVAMLFHTADWKGSTDGLKALEIAKKRFPGLKVELFGVPAQPRDLPEWAQYTQKPTQTALRAIYNRAAIFISPSWAEGWPLPPAEAMMCGAAVVATDIGGHQEFCLDGQTALLAPPKSPELLAERIIQLLQDNSLRNPNRQPGS